MTKASKENKIDIINKTKTNPSIDGLVFRNMKKAVLGDDYDLSLVFINKNEIKKINKSYRNIDKATDILSFPLNDKEGEIFICEEIAVKEAPNFNRECKNFLKFLFIHGLTHLKGFEHSDKMENKERKFRKMFEV